MSTPTFGVFQDGDCWVCDCPELKILAAAPTQEEAREIFWEMYDASWKYIAMAPDAELTADAQALKRKMLAVGRPVEEKQ